MKELEARRAEADDGQKEIEKRRKEEKQIGKEAKFVGE